MSGDEVLDAIAAGGAYQPLSLSRPPSGLDDDEPMDVSVEEAGFEWAEGRAAIGSRVFELPARERYIVALRFDRGMTQSEIAALVGISQMHVSRLLAKALKTLQDGVGPVG